MEKIIERKNKPINEEEICKRVLPICENDADREYVFAHRFRFSFIFSKMLPKIKPGMCVANIGISVFDPFIKEIIEELSASYFNLVPNSEFTNRLHNSNFDNLNTQILDVCSPNPQLKGNHLFDIVLFYETMEHLLAPDELIIKNISNILNSHGKLMGSVPNALSIGRRIDVILGKNVHWPKKDIVSGVFGGYGHIREYAKYEIKNLLLNEFRYIQLYGYSPYGKYIRYLTRFLPTSFRSIIFFDATKAIDRWERNYEL